MLIIIILRKETENTIFAAQEQAVGMNSVKNIIYKENVSKECRLCGKADETIAHIASECQQLAQVQYKGWRQDKVAQKCPLEVMSKTRTRPWR